MARNILVVNGHPDASPERFCAALADAYAWAARGAGHQVETLEVGRLDFPLIRSREAFTDEAPPADIARAQEMIRAADHLVFIHPLWLGAAPALLEAFLEQVFRYGFAMGAPEGEGFPKQLLKGRSARIVVTMGMPGPAYGLIFGGFGVRAMERSVLRLAGIGPIHHDYIGMVEGPAEGRRKALETMAALGRSGR